MEAGKDGIMVYVLLKDPAAMNHKSDDRTRLFGLRLDFLQASKGI
jgi:hypothetical protein